MRRRSHAEIQSSDQIPQVQVGHDYYTLLTADYSSLIPSYEHVSITQVCSTPESSSTIVDDRIYYNGIYSYKDEPGDYHRDNYCIIPLAVPAMTLKINESGVNVPVSSVYDAIPKVSSMFNLKYDTTFLLDNSLAYAAYSVFGVKYDHNRCVCNKDKLENCYNDDTCQGLIAPIDLIIIQSIDISDEYAYIWEDLWDMSIIRIPGRRRPDESSSSSGSESIVDAGHAVYLCKVDTPPTGNGGTAIVSIISVSGSGAVKAAGGLSVNVPSI